MSSALVSAGSKGVAGSGLGLVVAGAGAAASVASSNNKEKEKGWWIPDGYEALRTRFGRARFDKKGVPIVKGPGFHPNVPFSHANKFISTQDRVANLGFIPIKREGVLTLVHAEATWGVVPDSPKDLHAAWLRVKEGQLDDRFATACGSAFNIVMSFVPVQAMEDIAEASEVEAATKALWENEDTSQLKELLLEKQDTVKKILAMTQLVAREELEEIGSQIRHINLRSDAPHPFTQVGVNEARAVPVLGGNAGSPTGGMNGADVVSIAGA